MKTDHDGMIPSSLHHELTSRFQPGDPGVPKVLYTNPTGSNPCGTVLLFERKQEIYRVSVW